MEEERQMGIFEHLEELRMRLKWCLLTVLILFVFFAGFQARVADVGGIAVPYPYPDPIRPFASQFFFMTLDYLTPANVTPVVTSPIDAIIVQFKTALFLALVAGMPMISYQMAMFIGPGLKGEEKRVVLRLVVPSVLLFAAGIALAFLLILPFTFSFLYEIAIALGAQPLLHLSDFLDFVLLFSIGFGLAFQVPVVMYALTAVGLVAAETWKKYWRFAVIAMFAFGAIITPDGSGITMILIAVPMSALYVAGYAACVLHGRRREGNGG